MVDLEEVKRKMAAAVDFTRREVASIRTGRANPAIVENVMIGAYGGTARMKVVELGTISVHEAQQLAISPYDQSIIGVIRMTFPPLTAERRLEYVRMLHVKLEDGRVKVRQIRHDKMSELKRQFEERVITEDDRHSWEKELQEVTDEMMEMIESMGKKKEEELKTL